jgi:hypothetical protein
MGWREIMAGGPVIDEEVEPRPDESEVSQTKTVPRPKPTGKANRLAVTALILACLAPLLVGGILGTVFGMVALDEVEESEGKERGAGMAKWAIGLGFVNILISCAFIVLMVAVVAT